METYLNRLHFLDQHAAAFYYPFQNKGRGINFILKILISMINN
jgi:hypothetical protein